MFVQAVPSFHEGLADARAEVDAGRCWGIPEQVSVLLLEPKNYAVCEKGLYLWV